VREQGTDVLGLNPRTVQEHEQGALRLHWPIADVISGRARPRSCRNAPQSGVAL